MMQKKTSSENNDTGNSIVADRRLDDALNFNRLMSQQVSAEELAEWLRFTEVYDHFTDDANVNISNASSSTGQKRLRSRRRSSNFFDSRRSSLDDPGNRPSFGLDAQTLLCASLQVNNGESREAVDFCDRSDIIMSPPLEEFLSSVRPRHTGDRARSSTPNSDSSNLTKNRNPFDRPIHGGFFGAPVLSSTKCEVFLEKKNSQDDDNSLHLQPLSTKKRRVSFSTDTGLDDKGNVILESNTNNFSNNEFSGSHERIRRCHSDREEYNTSSNSVVRSNHDISPRLLSLDLSSPMKKKQIRLNFPCRRAASDLSRCMGKNNDVSPHHFLNSLNHSQESSDFILRFESRRRPNHVVPIDNMYSRLEANVKSGKTRKLLVNALQRDALLGSMLGNGFGNKCAGEKMSAIGSERTGKSDGTMMLGNHYHPAGIVGSSNPSFQSHYSQIMCRVGKSTETAPACSSECDCDGDNYKFICHENRPSIRSRVEDDFHSLCQKVKAEEEALQKKKDHQHSAHGHLSGFENIDLSGK